MASSTLAHLAAFPPPTELDVIVCDGDALLVDTGTGRARAKSALSRAHGHDFGVSEKRLSIGKTAEGFREVPATGPSPDPYPAACQALGAAPRSSAACEDSGTGIRAARSAEPHLVTAPSLTGRNRDHDRLPDSPATPGLLQAWARAPHPAVSRAAG